MSLEEDLDEEDFERAAASWQKARSIPVRVSHEYYMAQLVKDPIEAAKLARAEAVKGLTVAQFAWGHMLLHGHGTARDPEAAFRWFQIAARNGDPESLNMVGRCYQRGWGVAEDLVEAARFLGLRLTSPIHGGNTISRSCSSVERALPRIIVRHCRCLSNRPGRVMKRP